MLKKLQSQSQTVKKRFIQGFQRVGQVIARFPLISFLILLAVLVGLAFLGDRLRTPEVVVEETTVQPLPVTTFKVGGAPMLSLQAKVEKSGTITLVAQTSGVVQKIKLSDGQAVKRGGSIFTLSSTYQGANAPAVSRKMSQVGYQFLVDNYQAQIDNLNRNREIARRGETQSSELRELNRRSVDDTKSLITLNENIISTLDAQLKENETTNIGGINDDTILQLKQAKSMTLSGLSNLRSGLRSTEYLNNNDEEPAKIGELSRDAMLQQLDLQEKTLALNKDIAHLTLRLAQINESFMYPVSPVAGTVERIHVKVGQAVNPGTVLATIRGDKNTATAIVLASQQIAQSVSKIEPSVLVYDAQQHELLPRSISQEPTQGSLHSIIYTLPESISAQLANDSYLELKLPIGPATLVSVGRPYIPLDAMYQSQNAASVNVVDVTQTPPVAKTASIKLGQVTGQYVEVLEGITNGDLVILNRTVVAGQPVKVQ